MEAMFLSIDTIHFFTKTYSHSYLSGLWALSWYGIIPEKAIADYLYLESGEWDSSRMESVRFDPHEIDDEKLETFLSATGEHRLKRALRAWRGYAADQAEGMVVL